LSGERGQGTTAANPLSGKSGLAIWTGLLVWEIILLIFIIPTLALSLVNERETIRVKARERP
jgi:hypothetical protein